jgi:predicted LPLAT superfamily acyltransferase
MATLWQGKSKASPLGYRIFVWLLRHAGVKSAYFLLFFVSFYYFLTSPKSTRALWELYRRRLSFGFFECILLIYRNYYLFGQSLIDRIVVEADIANKFSFEFEGENYLRSLVSLERGGILLSAHLGNWEIAGHLLKRLNTRINVVMYDEEKEKIKDYLDSVKGEKTIHVIPIKNNLSHVFEISEALRNHELVCMHADRFLREQKTFREDFLRKKASFPMGPFLLAAQFQVPVSITFAMKESATHYHFSATNPKNYDRSSKTSYMKELLADFITEMEKKVIAYPAQWYNYYDFWARLE